MKCFKSVAVCLLVLAASAIARPSTNEEPKRLIQRSETEPALWLTQNEIYALIENKVHFMDITNRHFPAQKAVSTSEIPTEPRFTQSVYDAMSKLSSSRIGEFIVTFSGFNNRHYQSDTGVEASEWLLAQVNEAISTNGYTGKATGSFFTHTWRQNSVIARIEGTDAELKDQVVILGAHLDSIVAGVDTKAPGADDNASGSAALLEAFRSLLESGFSPKRTIEFQWYAAEEVGLLGSGDIAELYYDQGIPVVSMLNFDVVGYFVQGRDEISFLTDYTSDELNAFLRKTVEAYLNVFWDDSICGYGCSDHASWNQYGYPVASPSEAVLSPYMHTSRDVVMTVSFLQVLEFSKLGAAYAIELSEPNTL